MNTAAYYKLKAALALYEKPFDGLNATEKVRASKVATQYTSIEAVVLSSTEAQGVCLPPDAIDKAIAEIRQKHPDPESFQAALAKAELTEAQLASALQRDLMVDAVMARVGSAAGQVGETEAEIFYYTHLDRFHAAERRHARHILITVNASYTENTLEQARRRIEEIARRLQHKPARFEEQAIKHSECPTALNGGLLGDVRRGQLYPELEAVLFQLQTGELSDVTQSELGFHLLRCDAIHPERTLAYPEVAESLRSRLTEERAQKEAKRWLAERLKQTRSKVTS